MWFSFKCPRLIRASNFPFKCLPNLPPSNIGLRTIIQILPSGNILFNRLWHAILRRDTSRQRVKKALKSIFLLSNPRDLVSKLWERQVHGKGGFYFGLCQLCIPERPFHIKQENIFNTRNISWWIIYIFILRNLYLWKCVAHWEVC